MPAVRHRLPIAPASLHDFDAALAAHHTPPLQRGVVTTLQVNVGKLCNQACHHCHVEAGPKRTEIMSEAVATRVLELLATSPQITTLDLTGGAPEMNPSFRRIVVEARRLGRRVIDRCNLTILFEPGMAGLAAFLAEHDVEVVASLPCYTADNVEQQRGHGVFAKSIAALRQLNALATARPDPCTRSTSSTTPAARSCRRRRRHSRPPTAIACSVTTGSSSGTSSRSRTCRSSGSPTT